MNALLAQSDYRPHKLTVDMLLALERAGGLSGLPRLELLDGALYQMSPQTSAHVVAKNELGYRLRVAIERLALPLSVLTEPTVIAGPTNAPEPDIAVLTQLHVDGYYPANLVRLAVEVAVTTVAIDLGAKKSIYAAALIPEYWVLDVPNACFHQFWSPVDGDYCGARRVDIGTVIVSHVIPELTIATTGLMRR